LRLPIIVIHVRQDQVLHEEGLSKPEFRLLPHIHLKGTVLRISALGDERLIDTRTSRLISPIQWSQVLFLFSNHLDLTRHPAFTDNLLYFLLESQKN
jgi:hypothetical protein